MTQATPDQIVAAQRPLALAKLGDAQTAYEAAERRRRSLTVAARKLGCSWAEIAAVLGVSKQAAQQRYGWHLQETGCDGPCGKCLKAHHTDCPCSGLGFAAPCPCFS